MKFLAVVLLFAAVAFAIEEEIIPILRSDVERRPDGEFSYDVETGNGIHLYQKGHLLKGGEEGPVVGYSGSYSYTDDNGVTYTVSYTADERGFRAAGSHFPVAPIDPHHH